MITAYRSSGEAIVLTVDAKTEALSLDPVWSDIVWIDLNAPTRAEDDLVEKLVGTSVPTREDLRDIEPSSRLYVEGDVTYMTASLMCHADSDRPILTDVAFVLAGHRLLTVRYDDPKSFLLFAASMHRTACKSGADVLVRLLETIVDRTAEILEHAEVSGDELSLSIFANADERKTKGPRRLENLLVEIAAHHRLVAKCRDSLATLARLTSYMSSVTAVRIVPEDKELCLSMARDIQSLSEHAGFISANNSFLLDATLGLINVEQNGIIKIFSIASVVFLPPTLVASLYGMNFRFMPELEWSLGYPLALLLMLISAIIPFYFFRWKGWL